MPGVHWAWCFHSGSWKLEATNLCVCDAWKLSCGTQQLHVWRIFLLWHGLCLCSILWNLSFCMGFATCWNSSFSFYMLHALCSIFKDLSICMILHGMCVILPSLSQIVLPFCHWIVPSFLGIRFARFAHQNMSSISSCGSFAANVGIEACVMSCQGTKNYRITNGQSVLLWLRYMICINSIYCPCFILFYLVLVKSQYQHHLTTQTPL